MRGSAPPPRFPDLPTVDDGTIAVLRAGAFPKGAHAMALYTEMVERCGWWGALADAARSSDTPWLARFRANGGAVVYPLDLVAAQKPGLVGRARAMASCALAAVELEAVCRAQNDTRGAATAKAGLAAAIVDAVVAWNGPSPAGTPSVEDLGAIANQSLGRSDPGVAIVRDTLRALRAGGAHGQLAPIGDLIASFAPLLDWDAHSVEIGVPLVTNGECDIAFVRCVSVGWGLGEGVYPNPIRLGLLEVDKTLSGMAHDALRAGVVRTARTRQPPILDIAWRLGDDGRSHTVIHGDSAAAALASAVSWTAAASRPTRTVVVTAGIDPLNRQLTKVGNIPAKVKCASFRNLPLVVAPSNLEEARAVPVSSVVTTEFGPVRQVRAAKDLSRVLKMQGWRSRTARRVEIGAAVVVAIGIAFFIGRVTADQRDAGPTTVASAAIPSSSASIASSTTAVPTSTTVVPSSSLPAAVATIEMLSPSEGSEVATRSAVELNVSGLAPGTSLWVVVRAAGRLFLQDVDPIVVDGAARREPIYFGEETTAPGTPFELVVVQTERAEHDEYATRRAGHDFELETLLGTEALVGEVVRA